MQLALKATTRSDDVVGNFRPSSGAGRHVTCHAASGRYRIAIAELLSALKSTPHDAQGSAAQIIARTERLLEKTAIYSAANDVTPSVRPALSATRRLAPWQVKLTKTYVASHLESKITTQQLATLARLSPFYFARAFKASFGDSPHRYLLQQRMQHSQGLMLQTSATLADIALDCGLVDQAHFGRVFRQLVGESPAAWRRAHTSGDFPVHEERRNVQPSATLSQTHFVRTI